MTTFENPFPGLRLQFRELMSGIATKKRKELEEGKNDQLLTARMPAAVWEDDEKVLADARQKRAVGPLFVKLIPLAQPDVSTNHGPYTLLSRLFALIQETKVFWGQRDQILVDLPGTYLLMDSAVEHAYLLPGEEFLAPIYGFCTVVDHDEDGSGKITLFQSFVERQGYGRKMFELLQALYNPLRVPQMRPGTEGFWQKVLN